jgi:hypothetical protein
MRTASLLTPAAYLLLTACSGPRDERVGGLDFGTGDATGDAGGADDGGPDGGGDDGGATDDGATGDDGDGGTDDIKYDVGVDGTGGPGDGEIGCSGVDILFVIDNSGSMQEAQEQLAIAFPGFAQTIADALPEDSSVHVGVTSTEMRDYDGNAGWTIPGCENEPDEGFGDSDDHYETPDTMPSGVPGAQGRLFPVDGQYYFAANTSDATSIADLSDWFEGAAQIGIGGSNIEMSSAAAGWAADPANAATNAGFIRDAGYVLALVFVSDEPDSTPDTINGNPGGTEMMDKLAAAKAECGGRDCIVGGGLVVERCQDETPLGTMFSELVTPGIVRDMPLPTHTVTAADFQSLLEDTLAQVIEQACDDIPPAG